MSVANDQFFIERREQGDFAIRRANSERASGIAATQKDAIARARELNPNASIHVERIRNTKRGSPDNGERSDER